MPRKRSAIDPAKDPLGFLEQHLLPKALRRLDHILGAAVERHHPQYVRSLTIQRAAAATVINGTVALKQLGISRENADKLGELLERIKRHDRERELLSAGERKTLEAMALPAPARLTDAEPDADED